MKVQIFSDLHADVAGHRPIAVAPDIDAVVVAGDTCEGAERGFIRLRRIVPMQIPIVAVLGNHEYYRRHFGSELATARQSAALYGIHLLEDDVVTLGDVRFIGCSMWTDYALAAYVSNLTSVIDAGNSDLWVHGQVHTSFDYCVGETRILCNPHGYGLENPQFDPALVVEVAR